MYKICFFELKHAHDNKFKRKKNISKGKHSFDVDKRIDTVQHYTTK